jgi:hypothetical protein
VAEARTLWAVGERLRDSTSLNGEERRPESMTGNLDPEHPSAYPVNRNLVNLTTTTDYPRPLVALAASSFVAVDIRCYWLSVLRVGYNIRPWLLLLLLLLMTVVDTLLTTADPNPNSYTQPRSRPR